jgi:hypothetical protein
MFERKTGRRRTIQTDVRFEHFCFESTEQTGIILNYATLSPLLKTMPCKEVIDKIVAFVAIHMHMRERSHFVVHLICNGMQILDLASLQTFMLKFAQMFKKVYPSELEACYVHGAPAAFASVYELFRSILPKASREKIILVPATAASAGANANANANPE